MCTFSNSHTARPWLKGNPNKGHNRNYITKDTLGCQNSTFLLCANTFFTSEEWTTALQWTKWLVTMSPPPPVHNPDTVDKKVKLFQGTLQIKRHSRNYLPTKDTYLGRKNGFNQHYSRLKNRQYLYCGQNGW